MTDWTLPENLKKLKEMAERATPGPWTPMVRPAPDYEDHGWRCLAGIWGGWMVAVPKEQIPSMREADESNTLFIAATREALPQLINKIILIQEAFAAIRTGELSEDAALMAIGMLTLPQELTPEDKVQAKQWIDALEKERT